jgi:hypothetical protein
MTSRTLPTWRKLAWAAWRPPSDPQFYGELDVDAEAMLDHIAHVRATSGRHVTVTHLVGRAVAHGLARVPELRTRVVLGREHDRESIDVFFITSVHGDKELSGVKISDVAHKSAVDVAEELARRHSAITPRSPTAPTRSSAGARHCSGGCRSGCCGRCCAAAPGSRRDWAWTSARSACRGRRSAVR